jgi:hypothetical protein
LNAVRYGHLGRLNEGVMKATNFNAPKHGGVTYLTVDELKAVAALEGRYQAGLKASAFGLLFDLVHCDAQARHRALAATRG